MKHYHTEVRSSMSQSTSNSWRSFLRKIQVSSSFSATLSVFLQDWFTNKNLEYCYNTRIPTLLNNWFIQNLCYNKSSVHILFFMKPFVTTLLFLVQSVLFVCQVWPHLQLIFDEVLKLIAVYNNMKYTVCKKIAINKITR